MTTKTLFNSALALALGISLVACEKKTERPALAVPTVYESANFTANVATQTALTAQLGSLTTEMKKGRVNGVTVSKTTLENLFTTGTTSLKSQCSAYYAGKVEGMGGYIDELSKASGGTYTPSSTISGNGGTYGGYLFDEYGLEYEQMIEKGQFGAILFKHLTDKLAGEVSETTVDQVLAIIGGNPTFPNSNSANVPQPDKLILGYITRRDMNDGNGMYTKLKQNFLKLKAAIRAGSEYNAEKQEAIAEIKLLVEKGLMATVINYCHSVFATLTTNPSELTSAQKAGALHAYSECVGFVHGFRNLTQKRITDTQIDEILTLFNAPYNGTPSSYKFLTDSFNESPKVTQVINKLKDIYGFTAQEIIEFKSNWVSVQGR